MKLKLFLSLLCLFYGVRSFSQDHYNLHTYVSSIGEETCATATNQCTQTYLSIDGMRFQFQEVAIVGGHPAGYKKWEATSEQTITTKNASYIISVRIDQYTDGTSQDPVSRSLRIQILSSERTLLAQGYGTGDDLVVLLPEELSDGQQKSLFAILGPPRPHPGTTGTN